MEKIINFAYIISSIMFIFGIKFMSKPDTARKGNLISSTGMLTAVIFTLLNKGLAYEYIIIGLLIGAAIGVYFARTVKMTGMPEMVALLNGFGGLSSLLVAFVVYINENSRGEILEIFQSTSIDFITLLTVISAIFIGGVTFTGSMVAWGKLSTKLSGKPMVFPFQKEFNLLVIVVVVISPLMYYIDDPGIKMLLIIALILISLIFGITSVIPIGGADMPVVISLLNSYSGLAASTAGIAIKNNLLIVTGVLVGASGIILTNIMCKAMNRSLANVLFSGMKKSKKVTGETEKKEHTALTTEDAFYVLEAAKSVMIVPGYGMAVAQAQHTVKELTDLLEKNDCEVYFGIHPVAGRMPGHMNVLLAEASIPYEQLKELEDSNNLLASTDVAIVIGANDVVNTSARDDENSEIYGMPILEVDKAKTVFVLKRSMNTGYAGIDNPLFYLENSRMIFGDAKETIQSFVSAFKEI
ncbi:MAG: NAD(P)(+) transhydrogenase (Re/Si-specific) subunit beta [Fusobacteria bacterium]|nr:NAD(P)(+) transhydrogenase (Re/Si-specific) subunit beta [Fusobacteriota bacterium]